MIDRGRVQERDEPALGRQGEVEVPHAGLFVGQKLEMAQPAEERKGPQLEEAIAACQSEAAERHRLRGGVEQLDRSERPRRQPVRAASACPTIGRNRQQVPRPR